MYVGVGLADTALENPRFIGKTCPYKTWVLFYSHSLVNGSVARFPLNVAANTGLLICVNGPTC